MPKNKLKWKKKWLSDKSGYWYSAKVPILNWEYIVDGVSDCESDYKNQEYDKFMVGVFLSYMNDDIVKFTRKKFRKKETAMESCEKHLQDITNKFIKWFNQK